MQGAIIKSYFAEQKGLDPKDIVKNIQNAGVNGSV
jgi:hypothetical protein